MTQQGVRRLLLSGTAALASVASVQVAHAQANTTGTAAGTPIVNTARASYTVNNTARTAASPEVSFLVDRKVNLTVVASQNGNTVVTAGQTGAVTTFTVTNKTNGIQDILISGRQGEGVGGGGLDNFDVTNLTAYLDTDGSGGYTPGTDQAATFIDELGPDQSRLVFLVGDVPTADNQTFASVSLRATVAAGETVGAGAELSALDIVNQPNQVDVVFADDDSDGLGGADILRNGQGRAYLEYELAVNNVNLAVAKSATVVSDGYNTVLNAKALPGAVVQYCITVTNNTLLTPADDVAITDIVPANTTYVADSIEVGGLGTGGACLLGGLPANDDGTQNPLSPYGGSYDPATRTVRATTPRLLGGGSFAASFRVTIN